MPERPTHPSPSRPAPAVHLGLISGLSRAGRYFSRKEREGNIVILQHFFAVGRRGLEPRTYGLKVRSSTIELATQRTNASMKAVHHIATLGCRS